MKKTKLVSALALSLSLLVPSLHSAQAATQLTYTQTGSNYMYSNSPETIKGTGAGYEHRFESGKYSYYTLQRYTEPNKEYVAEFYNHNNAGMDLQFGYAIYNGSNVTRYVTIKNDSIKTGKQDRRNSMTLAGDMEVEYMHDTRIETRAIPAWGSIFIKEQKVAGGNTITGKLKFFTDGNLTVRQFVSKEKTDKTFPTPAEVMDLNKTPQVKISTSKQTTANFRTDTRKVTIDANKTKSFYVGSVKGSAPDSEIGINEYEEPIDRLANTEKPLQGNYGIVYEFHIKNGAGKQIKILPNFWHLTDPKGTPSTFVYFDGQNWKRAPIVEKSEGVHTAIPIPSNGVFKYILPGGTNGAKLFTIEG